MLPCMSSVYPPPPPPPPESHDTSGPLRSREGFAEVLVVSHGTRLPAYGAVVVATCFKGWVSVLPLLHTHVTHPQSKHEYGTKRK